MNGDQQQTDPAAAGSAKANATIKRKKARFKWEPPAAMIAVLLLGVWLVYSGRTLAPQDIRDGAYTLPLQVGNERGLVEVLPDTSTPTPTDQPALTFRLLFRSGETIGPFDETTFAQTFGQQTLDDAKRLDGNVLFKLLNITTWAGVAWVAIGFLGQAAFFGRMAIQWIASERERRSVVPAAFWYLSLAGGVMLFVYFVWRQDIVGVTGQTTGVVIYARNIRLLHKHKTRQRRKAQPTTASTHPPS